MSPNFIIIVRDVRCSRLDTAFSRPFKEA